MFHTEPSVSSSTGPTLTDEEREALFRRYDVWLRSVGSSRGSKKCHLPATVTGDDEDNIDGPRPVCGQSIKAGKWAPKDPACFPGEWARLCSNCAECVAASEW